MNIKTGPRLPEGRGVMGERDKISTKHMRYYADHACFIDAEAREMIVNCADEIDRLTTKAEAADKMAEALQAVRDWGLAPPGEGRKWSEVIEMIDTALAAYRGGGER